MALPFVVYLVGTSGLVLRWASARAMSKEFGGHASVGGAQYLGDGWIELREVVVRAPGIEGPAGEVASARSILVQIDLLALRRADVDIHDVSVDGLTLRLSEDARKPGSFNFMGFDRKSSGESKELRPPQIQLKHATVEFGEHQDGTFTPRVVRRVEGWMSPTPAGGDWYSFRLTEMGGAVGERIRLTGQWNVDTFESWVEADALQVDERLGEIAPRAVRTLWEQMDVQGRVTKARIGLSESLAVQAELDLKDVALTIPVPTEELWSGFSAGARVEASGLPRMKVSSGRVRITDDEIVLEKLVGTLSSTDRSTVQVPYTVSFRVGGLRSLVWERNSIELKSALRMAPFEMTVRMTDFSLPVAREGEPPPVIELPTVVATILQKFEMTGWELDSEITLSRAAPIRGSDGSESASPIRWSGQAYITHAAATYQKFKYPMTNIEAFFRFDDEAIIVEYLTGTGSGGSSIAIHGRVAPPLKDSAVNLKVTAMGVPIDDAFRGALEGGARRAIDSLFHKASYEALVGSGLMPTETTVAAAMARKENLVEIAVDDPWRSSEIQRLDRQIAVGNFALGGVVDLDVNVKRPEGRGMRTTADGTITVRSADVVVNYFPYPFRVTGGSLKLSPEAIVIAEPGLTAITCTGGSGLITGRVDMPQVDGKRSIRPNLSISVAGDIVNDALLAAIPPTGDAREDGSWPGGVCTPMAAMVKNSGLVGDLSATGVVNTDAQGQTGWDFSIGLSGGRVGARAGDDRVEVKAPFVWPAEYGLDEVSGLLRVTRDLIDLKELRGVRGGGEFVAAMRSYLGRARSEPTVIDVEFDRAPIERGLLDFLPAERLGSLPETWSSLEPAGEIGGSLQLQASRDAPWTMKGSLYPQRLALTLGGERAWMRFQQGSIAWNGSSANAEDLRFSLGEEIDEGRVTMNASVNLDRPEEEHLIAASFDSLHLDSALVSGLVRRLTSERIIEEFDRLRPQGMVDGVVQLDRRPDAPLDYMVSIQPQAVSADVRSTRVGVNWSTGSAVLTPGLVELRDLRGEYGSGQVAVSGTVTTSPGVEADLGVSIQGSGFGPELRAFLPSQVRRAFEAIDLTVEDHFSLTDGHIRMKDVAGATPRVEFTGRVQAADASFQAAMGFTRVNGIFDIDAAGGGGDPQRLEVDANVSSMLAAGRRMTSVNSRIWLDEPASAVRVEGLTAELYGGRMSLDALVGVGTSSAYEVSTSLVGADLGRLAKREDVDSGDGASTAAESGDTYADLSISGRRDDPSARVGMGSIRIQNGKMANLPLTLRILQLSQLMLPISDSLDDAQVEFFIRGNWLEFEKCVLQCQTLRLRGEGGLTLPDFVLDSRFYSRGRLTLVSDVIGGVSDALFAIEVRGPLGDPTARLVALPGLSERPGPERAFTAAPTDSEP